MLKRPYSLAAVALLLVVHSSVAAAQTCVGFADQALVAQSLTVAGGASGSLRRLSGQLTMTGQRFFGSETATYIAEENSRRNPGVVLAAEVGYAKVLPAALVICPRAQLRWHSSRGDADERDFATASLGGAIGRAIPVIGWLAIVPSLHAGLAYRRWEPAGLLGASTDDYRGPTSRRFGEVGAALGVRVNDVITVRPAYTRPVGLGAGVNGGYDETYSLSISIGRRRR